MIVDRVFRCALALGAAAALVVQAARADERCASRNVGGVHCGECLDSFDTKPCAPGETTVVYDLGQPFPPDPSMMSHAVIRASPFSPCAGMPDKPVPITGFAVGCWTPPDQDGCRVVKFLNGGSMCLHIADQRLGQPCSGDCADVSTEQLALSNAGAAEHFVCPPNNTLGRNDPHVCAAQRSPRLNKSAKFRLWVGGFCATNGCDSPGNDPHPGPNTCVASWGATFFGYAVGKSKALGPGWYDWKTGAFKVDYRNGKATCGRLGACLGAGSRNPWDLTLVATPRPGQVPPCLTAGGRDACDSAGCFQ